MTKYIVITGGVISGVGKGIIASSTGFLLKAQGLDVTAIKIDPYLNIDAGTISPLDHGEVFVLDDGGEVDMDLGNYERFLDVILTKDHNMTTGKIYSHVIDCERRGDYLGSTVQVVPHITNAIQDWVERVSAIPVRPKSTTKPDICIVELGGTVGDIESAPFIEAMRQFQFRVGHNNFSLIHVSLIPVVSSVGEQKTKPTQSSVRDLRGLGLLPDIIACRSTKPIDSGIKEKISMFCHVPADHVIAVHDCSSIYHVPLLLEGQGLLKILREKLSLPDTSHSHLLNDWKILANNYDTLSESVNIVLVGKYTNLHDSYISVIKSLEHAALFCYKKLVLSLVESSNLEEGDSHYEKAWSIVKSASGIIIPGGFGERGTQGIVNVCHYARVNNVPFFGICLAFQLAAIEVARSILGMEDANSTEINPKTNYPIVIFMPEISSSNLGGTMRLGSRPSRIVLSGIVKRIYDNIDLIHERHRHRYEINPVYIKDLESAGISFVSKDESLVRMEILEIKNHPFFVAVQFHPEFKSRPLKPSPIFVAFIKAASN